MNLLVRSLSPSGQGSSSGSTGSPGGNRPSRGTTGSSGHKYFRQRSGGTASGQSKLPLGHSRSYAGDRPYHSSVQPHILFNLEADPPVGHHLQHHQHQHQHQHPQLTTSSSVTSPTTASTSSVGGLSKPSWLRIRKPIGGSSKLVDRYSSPPTPSDFDYYEYFSNYARSPSDPGDVATSDTSLINHQPQSTPPIAPIRLHRSSLRLGESSLGGQVSSHHSSPPPGQNVSTSSSLLLQDRTSSWNQHVHPSTSDLRPYYPSVPRSPQLQLRTSSNLFANDSTTINSASGMVAEGSPTSTGDHHFLVSNLHLKLEPSSSTGYAPVTSTTNADRHHQQLKYCTVSPPITPPSPPTPTRASFNDRLMLHPSVHSISHQRLNLGSDFLDHSLYSSSTGHPGLPGHRLLHQHHHQLGQGHYSSHLPPPLPPRPSSATGYYEFMDPGAVTTGPFIHHSQQALAHHLHHHQQLHHQQQQQQQQLQLNRLRHQSLYEVASGHGDRLNHQPMTSPSLHHSHQLLNVPTYVQSFNQTTKCSTTNNGNGGTSGTGGPNCFRISFIETTAYIAQDVPGSCTSPEHLPPNHRFNKHVHSEWVTESIEELRKLFKPPSVSILVNVEKKSKYPFIIFGKLPSDFDTKSFIPTAMSNVLSPDLRINDGIYDVIASIIRPITPLAIRSTNVSLKNYNCTSQYSQLDCLFNSNESGTMNTTASATVTSDPLVTAQQQAYPNCNVNNVIGQSTGHQGSLQLRTCPPLGYVILAFQTFPGEDSSKLEENWITWTGAQILYKYLPIASGLRRIVFFKRHDLHLLKSRHSPDSSPLTSSSSPPLFNSSTQHQHQSRQAPQPSDLIGDSNVTSLKFNSLSLDDSNYEADTESPIISYVLLCECTQLTETILTSVCAVIDQLRARCCGYSALYIDST